MRNGLTSAELWSPYTLNMSEVVPQQGFNAGHQAVLNKDGQDGQAFHSRYECVMCGDRQDLPRVSSDSVRDLIYYKISTRIQNCGDEQAHYKLVSII